MKVNIDQADPKGEGYYIGRDTGSIYIKHPDREGFMIAVVPKNNIILGSVTRLDCYTAKPFHGKFTVEV